MTLDDIINNALFLGAYIPNKTAVFYSGVSETPLGPTPNYILANELAEEYPDYYYTIDMTPGGMYLAEQITELALAGTPLTKDQKDEAWRALSAQLAQNAEGPALACVSGVVDPDGVFAKIELPDIRKNNLITYLNGVTPSSLSQNVPTAVGFLGTLVNCYNGLDPNLQPVSAMAPLPSVPTNDLELADGTVPVGGSTPLPNVQDPVGLGADDVSFATALEFIRNAGIVGGSVALIALNRFLPLQAIKAAIFLSVDELLQELPSGQDTAADAGATATPALMAGSFTMGAPAVTGSAFQAQGDQAVASAVSLVAGIAHVLLADAVVAGELTPSDLIANTPSPSDLSNLRSFLDQLGQPLSAQVPVSSSNTVTVGAQEQADGSIEITTSGTNADGSVFSSIYNGGTTPYDATIQIQQGGGGQDFSATSNEISYFNYDGTNQIRFTSQEFYNSGLASASDTVVFDSTTTAAVAANLILAGVTLQAGPDATSAIFDSTGSLRFGDFFDDGNGDPGLSATAHADGSLSLLLDSKAGQDQNIIGFAPNSITGYQISNVGFFFSSSNVIQFSVENRFGAYETDYTSILNNGSVDEGSGALSDHNTVVFSGTGGILTLEPATYGDGYQPFPILNFQQGDTIDLAGFSQYITGPYTFDVGFSAGTIEVDVIPLDTAHGTGALFQEFIPTVSYLGYAPDSVSWTPDGAGGVDVITSSSNALCFLAGALIATPRGEIPVECLAIGDTVMNLRGQARSIVWIGVGRVLATRSRRTAATPIIVRKGALGPNLPHTDLRVTKGHALFLDDVLIPVEFLVNHRSILWDDRAQEVAVYHIELETHDVLLANGAPAESYRDDGNRWLFQNANSGWHLPPKLPCAPVLTGGPIVDAVWRRLLDLAGPRPGVPLTDNPDLHLLIDGIRLDAGMQTGDFYIFNLRHAPTDVRIISRAAVPQELGLARDPRCLGVAVRRIVVRHKTRFRKFEANDKLLADGFHPFEADSGFRWTDGDSGLSPEMFAGLTGPIEVVLHIGATAKYAEGIEVSRVA